ncbi:DUF4286 family protein [Pseudofrankia inefficax]|uniref:Ethyl tert-butyl ether degradation EthD n=1 Tax=Pseudofrankia inefficax (strain DSM 45817 / CECT 9037 / DDB 130130 / EuI1c) TaxID=298654 RepID=E3JC29_PSEI1|nr:DUF4286 family protein [Pseudofrankia inefficax]ADP83485.1 hypothetical protein FraEuI1c_5499 [Pseudofrankia inefficax]
MPRGIMVVQSSPASPEQDAAFNKWYDEDHLPEMLAVAGFTAARRYRLRATGPIKAPDSVQGYLAVYEVEADDLDAALVAMRSRPPGTASDALSLKPPPVVLFYELLSEVTAPPAEEPG